MADIDRHGEAHEQAENNNPIYERLHGTPEFKELKKRYLGFVVPATIAFLAWYLLYVVMSNWATGFMDTKVVGHINVALVFGVLQFLTTFLIAILYSRHMAAKVDPLARQLEADYNKEVSGR